MMDAQDLRSGKTHRDENFPVAAMVAAPHRDIILAFYDFVRVADDVADHPDLSSDAKLDALERLESTLVGRDDAQPVGVRLREGLKRRGLADTHARDLLKAFKQDATKRRYADWDDLIAYCALSAMPVGRFVLDVHGESRGTWSASDPLCAALQIINHLQDCKEDRARLDRVYIPVDALERAGARIEDLDAARASPALRGCVLELAKRTRLLLREAAPLARQTRDFRLGVECAVIHQVAQRLVDVLERRDPLSEPVHFGKFAFLRIAVFGGGKEAFGRLGRAAGRPLGRQSA
jgi:hydroxysqualene synthase